MPDLNALNEYGVPLHACNGYRMDEHYWDWVGHLIQTSEEPLYVWLRARRAEAGLPRLGTPS